MARRNGRAGNRPGPERSGARRGARLAAVAALALILPIAFAAPAAGRTGVEPGTGSGPVAVEEPAGGDGEVRQTRKAGSAGLSHRHYYSTWRDARTYWSQESRYPTGGWLWTGRHYFFCQVEGEPHADGEGDYSTWWVLTDDDTGNRDVFVSATAFRDSEPWQPVEGLPRC